MGSDRSIDPDFCSRSPRSPGHCRLGLRSFRYDGAMRRTTTAVAVAVLLALTACSGSNDEAETDSPLEFPDVEALNNHIDERFDGSAELAGEDLTVMIESKGFEMSDKGQTVKVLEDVGEGVEFDYDTLTITAQTDNGAWGYRYDADTVKEASENEVMVDKAWSLADTGTNNAY